MKVNISYPDDRNLDPSIDVEVEDRDIWSAYVTLSIVTIPILKAVREDKHGYPIVDPDDVPSSFQPSDDEDEVGYRKWQAVIDEMIFAFENCIEPQNHTFCHNSDQLEMISTPCEDYEGYSSITFNHQKDPSKPPYWRDTEGEKLYEARIDNGIRLYGKYFRSLWT